MQSCYAAGFLAAAIENSRADENQVHLSGEQDDERKKFIGMNMRNI